MPDLGVPAERIARLIRDFPSFCSLLMITVKKRGAAPIPFRWDSWHWEQQEINRNRTGRDIILKSRQIGVTTLELARDFWFAYRYAGSNVVIMAHRLETVVPLLEMLKLMAEGLAQTGLLPDVGFDNVREWTFPSIRSTLRVEVAGKSKRAAEDKGRGEPIHRFHGTEVAFWGPHANTTWNAIEGSLTPTAEVTLESTANGTGNLFYNMVQEARKGSSDFRLHFFPWFQHKPYREKLVPNERIAPQTDHERLLVDKYRISKEQLKWFRTKARRRAGQERLVRQEYPEDIDTCFLASGRTYFDHELLDSLNTAFPLALTDEKFTQGGQGPKPLQGLIKRRVIRVYREPEQASAYILAADPSEGVEGDDSAFVILDRHGRLCAVGNLNTWNVEQFAKVIQIMAKWFNKATVVVERNNHGHAVISNLRNLGYYKLWPFADDLKWHDGKTGWISTPQSRMMMLDELEPSIVSQSLECSDNVLIAQMKSFMVNEKGKPVAAGKGSAGGATDDVLMAYAIGWYCSMYGKVFAPKRRGDRKKPKQSVGLTLVKNL